MPHWKINCLKTNDEAILSSIQGETLDFSDNIYSYPFRKKRIYLSWIFKENILLC